MPLSENNSPFSNCKPHNSPNSVKKFSFSSPNREKISFGFRANTISTELSSPKNKSTSSEPVSVKQSGLVPYIEDSSESSDASESYPSQNKSNSIASTNSKHLSKVGSPDSYKKSPQLEIKTKLSKSVYSTPSYSPISNSALKISATEPWIVMDPPQTPISSSSSSTGVNSTTDWDVIEASDLALNTSSTLKESKNGSIKESLSSPKLSMPEISPSKHFDKANESYCDLPSDGQMLNGHKISPSAENYDFRKMSKNKICFPNDEETVSFKRKYSDSNAKISKDSPYSEHNESRYSPLPKKVKHAENSPFLKSETDVRNLESKSKNYDSSSASSTVQHKHYNSNCDNNSRTFNGVLHFDKSTASPSKFSNNSPMENNRNNHSKGIYLFIKLNFLFIDNYSIRNIFLIYISLVVIFLIFFFFFIFHLVFLFFLLSFVYYTFLKVRDINNSILYLLFLHLSFILKIVSGNTLLIIYEVSVRFFLHTLC